MDNRNASHSRPRLLEVALPIREASADGVQDKSLQHGRISALHFWWARQGAAVEAPRTTEERDA